MFRPRKPIPSVNISSEEISGEMGGNGHFDIRTMIRMDILYNANGCDSVVILTLYVLGNNEGLEPIQQLSEVKVYPNPTLGTVYVEGSDILTVEVYDNISRHILTLTNSATSPTTTSATNPATTPATNPTATSTGTLAGNPTNSKLSFNLTNHAAGAYYVRVRTTHGTIIKKVIKK